jgi:predicted metal-dependent phosphotriesterase family hydrolase
LSRKVVTVLGPIEPEELGPTTMHEHVLVDLTCNFVTPVEDSERSLLHAPVTMDILGVLRRRPFSRCLDNVVLDDESLAIEELSRFRRAVMCHLDPVADLYYHLAVAARGVYVEYDCFGREYYSDERGSPEHRDSQEPRPPSLPVPRRQPATSTCASELGSRC